MKYFVILLLLSSLCFAEDNVKFLKKGDAAPFEGYLFTKQKELELRLMDVDLKKSKELNTLYEEKINIQDQRIEFRDKQIDDFSKRLSEQNDGFLSKALMFVLGAVVTTGIAFGVSKATK